MPAVLLLCLISCLYWCQRMVFLHVRFVLGIACPVISHQATGLFIRRCSSRCCSPLSITPAIHFAAFHRIAHCRTLEFLSTRCAEVKQREKKRKLWYFITVLTEIITTLLTVASSAMEHWGTCPPPRLSRISFLVHFGVHLTANYPSIV